MRLKMPYLVAISALAVAAVLSTTAHATLGDFNSMISESQEAQKDLSKKLKKNAEITETTIGPSEKLVIKEATTAENIVAPTADYPTSKLDKSASKLDRAQMNRLSQEFNDSQD